MIRLLVISTFLGIGLIASSSLAAENGVASDPSQTLTKFLSIHSQGVNYELGRGMPQDFTKAAEWYRRAAALGHADAQNDLAKLYDDGRGVSQDSVQAYFWYTLAAQQGNACAIIDRYRLGERMSATQITKAQLLLNVWKSTSKGKVLSKIK
ncbi:MAG: tetratricopeptide repeat protein [Acidiferrobacterales bacterium]